MIVATMPRCGSSMVAGLLATHGLWTGTLDQSDLRWNPRGSFENRPLKELVQRHCGLPPVLGKNEPEREADSLFASEVMSTLRADGYRGGYWLFKCSVLYARLFEPFDPIYVTVRREPLSMVRSYRRTAPLPAPELADSIRFRTSILDRLEREGAYRIDSERLIERNYGQAEVLIAALGLTFSKRLADQWVDPDLWHF